jgi:uncharacterized membrane protein
VLHTGLGVAVSAALTYLELFVIHAICQWCVISAVIVTVSFLIALVDLIERRQVNGFPQSRSDTEETI